MRQYERFNSNDKKTHSTTSTTDTHPIVMPCGVHVKPGGAPRGTLATSLMHAGGAHESWRIIISAPSGALEKFSLGGRPCASVEIMLVAAWELVRAGVAPAREKRGAQSGPPQPTRTEASPWLRFRCHGRWPSSVDVAVVCAL